MRRWVVLSSSGLGLLCLAFILFPQARFWLLDTFLPSPPPQPLRETSPPSPHPRLLRVGVGAMISPARTWLSYRKLFQEVARSLGKELAFVQRKTYEEMNRLLASGQVELAWICTGAWLQLREQRAARLLVVPQVRGRTTYRGYLVVSPQLRGAHLNQLAGLVIAYSDPLSLTGYRLPRQFFQQQGINPDTFFRSFFTFSHDNSLEALRRNLAQVAGVDALVFDYLAEHFPEKVGGMDILWRSPELPIPPLVVAEALSTQEVERLRQVFLAIHRTEEGKNLLQELGIDQFVLADEKAYQQLP
ncbi:MAG: PhnD/SsuA/transferrin family substrate-binding protein [Thermoanaerobaculaceae bacterium]